MTDRVIVQTLSTRWTKESRGAPGSSRRNATPQKFNLDPTRLPAGDASWHEVLFTEPRFLPVETYRSKTLPADFHRVSVLVEHETQVIAVQFLGSTCFRLRPGESGRVLDNLCEDVIIDGWRDSEFHKVVVHIAFAVPVRSDMFRRPPDQNYVSMQDLA